ncbi:MAG: hypothetical protein AB1758_34795 [Candidatus Eremiobacterota bacterium]
MDIAISKLVPDLQSTSALLWRGIVKRDNVLGLLHELSPEHSTLLASRLARAGGC